MCSQIECPYQENSHQRHTCPHHTAAACCHKDTHSYTSHNQHIWKVIDISLRAENAGKHRMAYDAGVEEFLSLVKHSEYVVTNSFHAIIFATQFCRPFVAFSRDYGDSKIAELLSLFGLSDRLLVNGDETLAENIDFNAVHERLAPYRVDSFNFLKKELDGISL